RVRYVRDWDASGEDSERDLKARVDSFWLAADGGYIQDFVLERIAIFKSDIKDFKLPPQLVKPDDTRAAKFTARHGKKVKGKEDKVAQCVELDALPPAELRRRIRERVDKVLDVEKWNRAIAIEKVELES